jgi:hypothetical protein
MRNISSKRNKFIRFKFKQEERKDSIPLYDLLYNVH